MNNARRVILMSLAVLGSGLWRPGVASAAVDVAAAAAQVRKADADWNAAAHDAGVDAWMAFYADDAIVLLPQDRLVSGRQSVRAAVTRLLARPGVSFEWRPLMLKIAPSGDLAYVLDAYELRFDGATGTPTAIRGRLVEIWRKQADGAWKCVVDTWNAEPPRTAEVEAPADARAAGSPVAVAPAVAPTVAPAAAPASLPNMALTKYGDEPVHYVDAIRNYFQDHLTDPGSLQLRALSKPAPGSLTSVGGGLLMSEKRRFGWIVVATINARNAKGRYVGFKRYTFLFRGEKIIDAHLPLPDGEMN
ncbi:MAG: DUF4440 domain-containing protein [Gammaproteobacteria bacterium]|nr:DUF4440 domain-containing protein [Gammaproteobacteria bacterium]